MNQLRFPWFGLVIASSALAAAAGCGSQVDVEPGGTTTGTAGAGAGTPCGNGPDVVLAMNRLLIGDTDRTGALNTQNGWRQYGLNLDGLTSTKTSTGLCKLAAGGVPSTIYPDGNDGIDNSFGKNILPILLSLAPDISAQTNDTIVTGSFTLMLKIEGLDASPAACTAVSKLYGGAQLGSPPLFDGTDVWPVAPESLLNPNDVDSARNVFLQSTIIDGAYRSGLEASFGLSLVASNFPIRLTISHARFEMHLDPDHAAATSGTIAGVLETEVFTSEIAKFATTFDQSFCDPNSPTVASILNQIRQASDIMKDGTQDPNAVCDGISIGLGFDMRRVQLGPIGPSAPPPPDPCGPTP